MHCGGGCGGGGVGGAYWIYNARMIDSGRASCQMQAVCPARTKVLLSQLFGQPESINGQKSISHFAIHILHFAFCRLHLPFESNSAFRIWDSHLSIYACQYSTWHMYKFISRSPNQLWNRWTVEPMNRVRAAMSLSHCCPLSPEKELVACSWLPGSPIPQILPIFLAPLSVKVQGFLPGKKKSDYIRGYSVNSLFGKTFKNLNLLSVGGAATHCTAKCQICLRFVHFLVKFLELGS